MGLLEGREAFCEDLIRLLKIANHKGTIQSIGKLLFIGQGSALDPLKGLLKKSLKNPQNF